MFVDVVEILLAESGWKWAVDSAKQGYGLLTVGPHRQSRSLLDSFSG
jgi:hypothetical protein